MGLWRWYKMILIKHFKCENNEKLNLMDVSCITVAWFLTWFLAITIIVGFLYNIIEALRK